MTEDDEVMLVPEASAFLKRPIATLYGWRLRRQGPPSFRQGRLVCYWKSDLEALEREAGASLMPAYGPERRPTEVDDLVAYLASLRGEP